MRSLLSVGSAEVVHCDSAIPKQKRAREDDRSNRTLNKNRRASLPSSNNIDFGSVATIRPSKSCNALNDSPGLSPVQLLRRLRGELDQSKLGGQKMHPFTQPSEQEVASYEVSVVSAVRSGNLDALRSLNKNSLNACNQFGESLLHMACRRGNAAVVQYMVEEAKVNVTVRDDFGRTVLHDAAWTSSPNKPVMEILLRAVHPEMLLAEDVRGHTPFDYARKEHWAEWVEFLSQHQDKLTQSFAQNVTS
jgi:ankyrin repeat protein